ncbi:NAD(P)-binding domain-containing protein [Streptomyces sp. NPDC057062]|uniref:NAD(P)-binding domain-containing protein n=1 Tax=unclassified Streptomyces TaxID=2593676 RepID=UPI001C6F2E19
MTIIGIIGGGEVGSQIARAALANGCQVVIANSRGPETLEDLVTELGPKARAARAAEAAEAGDFAVVAVPLKLVHGMPVEELAGKIVLDTNNYMAWCDGRFEVIDSGEKTVHGPPQEHLPTSKVSRRSLISVLPASRPPLRCSRPTGATDTKRLPGSRWTRDAAVRPVRFRHRGQQSAERILAHCSRSPCLDRPCPPDPRRADGQSEESTSTRSPDPGLPRRRATPCPTVICARSTCATSRRSTPTSSTVWTSSSTTGPP